MVEGEESTAGSPPSADSPVFGPAALVPYEFFDTKWIQKCLVDEAVMQAKDIHVMRGHFVDNEDKEVMTHVLPTKFFPF